MDYDFQKLGAKFIKHKWWIMISSILGLIISLTIATVFLTPKYQMTSQVLVIPNTQEQKNAIQSTEVQANLQLINTYNALIKSPKVLNEVNKQMDGRYTLNELRSQITPMTEENSQIINIVATGKTADEAAKLANQTADKFIKIASEIMSTSHLELLDKAEVSVRSSPIFPKKRNFAIVGFLGGFTTSIMIIGLLMMLTKKVKSENDFSELDVPILGMIGAIDDINQNRKEKMK